MFLRPFASLVAGLWILGLAGCGPARLNETRTWSLTSGTSARALDLPAQPKPQTITVEFSSTANEVSVYLFKADDAKGEDGIAFADSKLALGGKSKSKGDSFSAEVPANTATRLIARSGGRDTEVTIKVTNQK
jgi:hypothetical protein